MSKIKESSKINIIKIVEEIFKQAIDDGASDIHFEPSNKKMIVRFRVDGILHIVHEGKLTLYEFILARIKILADVETTGLPRPQEGNIKFEKDEDSIDMRVSIFPTSHGECVVIRILESRRYFGNYKDLGFTNDQANTVDRASRKSHGLILVTGPNGAGKSTTLFTILNKLNSPEKSLVTLEDPVERKIEMVRQTQINPEAGLTFASGLRYLLRQDPDVIMVGEIRDKETAQIAVQAAITGHLVLATIHTNNAAGAVARLINMDVEPFLLASALKLVTAQRLARLSCPYCREEYTPPKDMLETLGAPEDIKFFRSTGCDKCDGKGTKGRQGIHEVLVVSKAIEELIIQRPSDEQVNELAQKDGMMSLRRSALQKVFDGIISIEEAIRLTE